MPWAVDIRKCDVSRVLESACALGLHPLAAGNSSAICEKAGPASLRMKDHVERGPRHPRSLRHVSDDILDHLAPGEAPRPEEVPAHPQDHDN